MIQKKEYPCKRFEERSLGKKNEEIGVGQIPALLTPPPPSPHAAPILTIDFLITIPDFDLHMLC